MCLNKKKCKQQNQTNKGSFYPPPDGICPGSLKNNNTRVKFKKSLPEKVKCLGWKEKKLIPQNSR
jgi:hypothetical protein